MKSVAYSSPFWSVVYKKMKNKHGLLQYLLNFPLGVPVFYFSHISVLFLLLNDSNCHAPTLEHANSVQAESPQSFLSFHRDSSYCPFFLFQDSPRACSNSQVASASFRLVTDPQCFLIFQNPDTTETSVSCTVKHLSSF